MRGNPIPNKSLGQHWLHDDASLLAMVQAAHVTADDTVLEIGPGLGTLTAKLLQAADAVVAVEFDERLAQELPARLGDIGADRLRVVKQDILAFDLSPLPKDYKVVANIPYYLTSNLVRVLSEAVNQPAFAVLLVQKEVAERLAARPGAMSVLSVTAQFYWAVSLGRVVEAELFTPPPKVDSQIVILKRRAAPLYSDVVDKLLFRIVKAGFSERRKTLRNSISGGLHLSKEQAETLLKTAGIDAGLRAQSLTLEQWHGLYRAYIGLYPQNI